MGDLNLTEGKALIREGKGGKGRSVPFDRETKRALYLYLNQRETADDDPVFLAERAESAGDGLTRSGLFQLVQRLGKQAKISGQHCGAHRFRHTFAIFFLRNGGNAFTLKELLGRTSLTITNRYVALAEADIAGQHRKYSPVANLKSRHKR